MSKNILGISLLDLLPENLRNDSTVLAMTKAIDPQLAAIANVIPLPSIFTRIDELTSEQLDHLAAGWDVSVWRDYWPVALKRSVVKAAFVNKRKQGTLMAVRQALESIGSAARIVEWWQESPKGEPHTFKVYATVAEIEGTLSDELQEDLILLINESKPTRSHYTFSLVHNLDAKVGVTATIRPCVYARV